MNGKNSRNALSTEFDSAIFDLDGVVTDTASVHARAWKALFDETSERLPAAGLAPFDVHEDYGRYVDGRSREDGIRTFLASRGIELPEGRPDDTPAGPQAPPTVAALAARKQELFQEILAAEGVLVFPGTVALLRRLRNQGLSTALVTSSRNSGVVLQAAGLSGLFDVRVDGLDAARLGLAGKPDPAIFLEAARQLGVEPARAFVMEDSEAGVQAASRGGFGLVVGIDHAGNGARLRAAGADLVVSDLGELELGEPADPRGQVGGGSGSDPWLLRYDGFDPPSEGLREALCTLGNGYWGTRGAAPEAEADATHYPGTYLAGVYNRLHTETGTRSVEHEHMVNAPNWLPLWFRVADGGWFRPGSPDILAYRQELDLRRGLLTRVVRFRDDAGRTTTVASRRFVSQAAHRVAVLETTFEAEDWSGPLAVRSALDGQVANLNVAADRLLDHVHLVARRVLETDDESILVEMETNQSGVHIAMGARTRVFEGGRMLAPQRRFLSHETGWAAHEFELRLEQGRPLRVEKAVVVTTSRDRAIASPARAVATGLERLADPADLLAAHVRQWQILWDEFAVHVSGSDRQSLALNLNIFHVLQTVAAVDMDLDAGVPARGLHGEGYRGHVFWDELFVYPILTLRRPDLSRILLGYRYRRLDEARAAAREAGFEGAMFPWQSGIDGREVTPSRIYNPHNGQWMPDNSYRQRHVGLAVAYSMWNHYQATGDTTFLVDQGAEVIIEVARFFAALATYDGEADRYDIEGVMGPDEFHDGYPGRPGQGLRNNTYTNVMAAWVLRRAIETVDLLEERYCEPLLNRLALRPDEPGRWRHIGRRLRIPFHADGVPSQFEGYEDLPEFDWTGYRERYGDIGRLDLILAAEGDNTNNYRLSKQADVLMLLYLFSAEELRGLLHDLGYPFPPEAVVRTVDFYRSRSTDGSTLSNVVHSWVEARSHRAQSWDLLTQALESDLSDIQGGTTKEGIHLGAMAGSIDMVIRCYTGLEIRDDALRLHPVLPAPLTGVVFFINYREQLLRIDIDADSVRLKLRAGGAKPIKVIVEGQEAMLSPGQSREFAL